MNIFDFILSTINILFALSFLSLLFSQWKKQENTLLRLFSYFLIYSITILQIYFNFPVSYKILTVFIVSLFLLRKCYILSSKIFFLNICSYVVAILAGESIGFTVAKFLFPHSPLFASDANTIIISMITNIISLFFILLLKSTSKYAFENTRFIDIFFTLIPTIVSILILYVLNFYTALLFDTTKKYLIIPPILIICLVFANIFISYYNLRLKERERLALIELSEEKKQFAFFQSKEQANEKLADLYHDLKNHLLTLQLIEDSTQAKKYINEMLTYISPFEKVENTGNPLLDALLWEKINEANSKNIIVNSNINFQGVTLPLSQFEVSSLFGNLLTNAIEACQNTSNSIIELNGKYVDSNIIISIENPITKPIHHISGKFISTKNASFFHGRGISIMKKIVENHNGHIHISTSNYIFKVIILLPTK